MLFQGLHYLDDTGRYRTSTTCIQNYSELFVIVCVGLDEGVGEGKREHCVQCKVLGSDFISSN